MLKSMINLGMLGFEAQQVMVLRSLRIAGDLASAGLEIQLMVAEKMLAAAEANVTMARRGSVDSVVSGYRRKVRANKRRLARRRS
ncbi:MAG TPA: hypothetical protein VNS34_03380 [Rhizobiaceae bacterium]|nr:hypothetical protein [Rhizobiaceae bacterium]